MSSERLVLCVRSYRSGAVILQTSMQQFDITLKSLVKDSTGIFLQLLTGSRIRSWLNVELPQVRNRRVDQLGETDLGDLVHIELQSANDSQMALRMARYFLTIYEQRGRAPRQIVLYVGQPALSMPDFLALPDFNYRYQIIDVRTLDGDLLLASLNINDNILSILAQLRDSRSAVRQIVSRIATLEEAERQVALTQLMILAGLRSLEQAVTEEVHTMPATINLLENKILGPMILKELEKGMEKGIQEGREKGIQEGREKGIQEGMQQGMQQGRVSVLCRQLEKRFGTLPQTTHDRLAKLSSDELDELSLKVLDAQNIDELFAPRHS